MRLCTCPLPSAQRLNQMTLVPMYSLMCECRGCVCECLRVCLTEIKKGTGPRSTKLTPFCPCPQCVAKWEPQKGRGRQWVVHRREVIINTAFIWAPQPYDICASSG